MPSETGKKKEENSVEQNLSEDYVPKAKLGNLPVNAPAISPELQKEMEKTKGELEKYKKEILKKFKYIEAIGIIPQQANQKLEEEYEVPKEDAEKNLIHILTIIPEDNFKEIGKVRLEAIKLSKEINEKFWVHVMTPVDVWNVLLDSKFEIGEAFGMCMPIMDKGLLGALRVSQVHKTLVLKKFEKYVTSYVISGSLTRGEARKDSDVDVFVIIDDTDVKRMPRLELKEKLRGIIFAYIQEASAIAGVKNLLNVQTYLMTEFWESVKDANPVMFTFIRDGVPLYDRGAFLPWKSLLKMGKIKPSPEAIDKFMSAGDKLEESIDRRLLDIIVMDIYWGVLTPSQGLLMLYGLAPPTPKETVRQIKEVFFEKEKILEKRYVDIFEKIVQFYKDYEHGNIKKATGKQLDEFKKDSLDYMKRLKELRVQIEKRVQEKSIQDVYDDVFKMLGSLLGKSSEKAILNEFEEKLIKQGKFPKRFLEQLEFIAKTKKEIESGDGGKDKKKAKDDKMGGKEMRDVEAARRHSAEIVNALVEYTQRLDYMAMDRTRFKIKPKNRNANIEVFFLENVFVVEGSKISKLGDGKLENSDTEELKQQLMDNKDKEAKIDFGALNDLKKIYDDFELIY
jgi:predicted nucleotidyltransferase